MGGGIFVWEGGVVAWLGGGREDGSLVGVAGPWIVVWRDIRRELAFGYIVLGWRGLGDMVVIVLQEWRAVGEVAGPAARGGSWVAPRFDYLAVEY